MQFSRQSFNVAEDLSYKHSKKYWDQLTPVVVFFFFPLVIPNSFGQGKNIFNFFLHLTEIKFFFFFNTNIFLSHKITFMYS